MEHPGILCLLFLCGLFEVKLQILGGFVVIMHVVILDVADLGVAVVIAALCRAEIPSDGDVIGCFLHIMTVAAQFSIDAAAFRILVILKGDGIIGVLVSQLVIRLKVPFAAFIGHAVVVVPGQLAHGVAGTLLHCAVQVHKAGVDVEGDTIAGHAGVAVDSFAEIVSGVSGKLVPLQGFSVVLFHAVAGGIHPTNAVHEVTGHIVLRKGEPDFQSLGIFIGLKVHVTELNRALYITLLMGAGVQLEGHLRVGFYAVAVLIYVAKHVGGVFAQAVDLALAEILIGFGIVRGIKV